MASYFSTPEETAELIRNELPKTADGVPVVMGMDVVTYSIASGWQLNRVLGIFKLNGVVWLSMARGAKVQPCSCYSTLEEADNGERICHKLKRSAFASGR